MATTTKLIVWNAALRELGAAPLTDTTSPNTRQYELGAAWDHCIERVLALRDWGFARRRSALVAVADTSFPPYTHRFAKPGDFLRKCWIKAAAADEHQVDTAEIAAVLYAFRATALLEYISDHADNYDPANWPPHVTRVVTLELASLVGPKLARAGSDVLGRLAGQAQSALAEADRFEALFLTNVALPVSRQPVFRRALEFLGQQLSGSVEVHAHTDMLRWAMNQAWGHAVRYVLEMGAWNHAAKRARLSDGLAADSIVPSADAVGIIQGYSYGTVADAPDTSLPSVSGWTWAWALPDDFRHKIWLKTDARSDFECDHQIIGRHIFTDQPIAILEYVAETTDSTNPELWSASFLEAVAAYLALLVSPELLVVDGPKSLRVTANDVRAKMEAVWRDKLSDAQMRDAIQQQPKALPAGRFVRARMGASYGARRLS